MAYGSVKVDSLITSTKTVTIDDMLDGSASTVTNTMLAGSIANNKLANSSISLGGVAVSLGATDATPAFNLSDATNYPTSSLSGTITNAQLAGSIANNKLANSTFSLGGVTVSLGGTNATPAFDLSDATNYPTSSLSGTITNAQLAGGISNSKLAGSIANNKLANSSVSLGGVTVSLGGSDSTPAFNLSDATNYPTSSLSGTITNAQLAGSIADSKLSTITSAGKVSGTAITSGTLSTTGSISTTSTVAVGRASAGSNTDLDVNGTYVGNVVSTASTIDCSTGNYFTITVNGNTTFAFSNVPSSRAYSLTLEITHTSGTISWPSSVKFPGDTAPTLTTGKTHVFIFLTDDGGTRFRAVAVTDYTN